MGLGMRLATQTNKLRTTRQPLTIKRYPHESEAIRLLHFVFDDCFTKWVARRPRIDRLRFTSFVRHYCEVLKIESTMMSYTGKQAREEHTHMQWYIIHTTIDLHHPGTALLGCWLVGPGVYWHGGGAGPEVGLHWQGQGGCRKWGMMMESAD